MNPLEFRPDHRGQFDEIVARFADGSVHVETMSDQGCYVGFYWDDGRYCQWWIGVKGRSKLTYNHEDGTGPPPKFPNGYGACAITDEKASDEAVAWAEQIAAEIYPDAKADGSPQGEDPTEGLHAQHDSAVAQPFAQPSSGRSS